MKIAVIEPVNAHGGMDYYNYDLMRSLARNGNSVRLYTSTAGRQRHDDLDVVEFFKGVYGKKPAFFRAFIWFVALFRSLRDARRFGAEVVHFHLFGYQLLYEASIRVTRMAGFKVVGTVHDVESFFDSRVDRKNARLFSILDGIIVLNQASYQAIQPHLRNRASNVAVINVGHYLDHIGAVPTQEKARVELRLPAESTIFLFFGQIKKVKGLDVALRAVAKVKKEQPDVLLLVGGKVLKDDLSSYESLIDELDLRGNVRLDIGYIDPMNVPYYYAASDAIVLPYRQIYQSGVLFMSMSYGIPVIVSDLPAMVEFIQDHENGFVFPVDDPIALSKAMLVIASDDDFASRLGASGKSYISRNFAWETIGVKTAEFYDTVLKND